MARSKPLILIVSSLLLVLLITLSLETAIKIQTPPRNVLKITHAQVVDLNRSGSQLQGNSSLNRTESKNEGSNVELDEAIITSSMAPERPSSTPSTIAQLTDGLIGNNLTASEPKKLGSTLLPPPTPASTSIPALVATEKPQLPILAMSYAGSAGPKRCRGPLLQKLSVPRPVSQWKAGTCIDLPAQAQCGVFYAGKEDNCEAQLFNTGDCFNSTETYVNTIVFMPEQRAIGGIWRSMFLRCGIDVPAVGQLDPGVLVGVIGKSGAG